MSQEKDEANTKCRASVYGFTNRGHWRAWEQSHQLPCAQSSNHLSPMGAESGTMENVHHLTAEFGDSRFSHPQSSRVFSQLGFTEFCMHSCGIRVRSCGHQFGLVFLYGLF